ncbi:MAG: hypothetical protein ACYC6W_02775 [Nitrosotalea sp.]
MSEILGQEFVWLEIKPQQKFEDDKENQILKIIQFASEFAFFIFRDKSFMRLIVRTTDTDVTLFSTIPGLTVEQITKPKFEKMVTKYLALKDHFMVPLVDLAKITKSDVYSKLWQEQSRCMMGCYVVDQTKKISTVIHGKVTSLDRRLSNKNSFFSNKLKSDLAAAKTKLDGHNLYNCFIVFGSERTPHDLIDLQNEKDDKLKQELDLFELRVTNLKKSMPPDMFKKEYDEQRKIYRETITQIKKTCKTSTVSLQKNIMDSTKRLDKIINTVLLNSFSHRISLRKVKFSSEKQTFRQKIAHVFSVKTVNPYTFVPKKLGPRSLALTSNELAFFLSLPQIKDVQTINFSVGTTPTFVHSPAEELSMTDLTIQCSDHQASTGDQAKLLRSISDTLKTNCSRCGVPIRVIKGASSKLYIDPIHDDDGKTA